MLVGEKIRNARKEKNMTISELASKIDVTAGYISQIERDLIDPSLSVLRRLCKAIQIPLAELFSEESTPGVVVIPAENRTKIKLANKNMTYEFLTPYIKDKDCSPRMEVFYYKLAPKSWGSPEIMVHEAEECNYIISGEIEYHIDGQIYTIKKGGSIYIPENLPHTLYNATDDYVEGIGILTPPVY